jgi:hypothetical protein
MKTNKKIQDSVENTFKAIDAMETVNVSPFFKDKVLQRLYTQKDETQTIWSWFTPQLQLATLACLVILNVFALTQLDSSTNGSDLDEFAQSYDLSITEETSIFN